MNPVTIGFGGGCHWCTEAVFLALRGVLSVEQGFISSASPNDSFSEAVRLQFDNSIISQEVLIEIHLRTHSSTSTHKLRSRYRSAIYTTGTLQHQKAQATLGNLQQVFTKPLITQVLPLVEFRASAKQYHFYYENRKSESFCSRFIDPKLDMLRQNFRKELTAAYQAREGKQR